MSDTVTIHYLPARRNLNLFCLSIGFQTAVFGGSALVWQWGFLPFLVLLLAHAYATVLCWLLIHEAIHYKLAPDRHRNDWMGRVLAVLFGCPFHILKVGHMTHHRYNRDVVDTTELVPHDTRFFSVWSLLYYARILGLLYVSEVIAPLAFYCWRTFRRFMTRFAASPLVEGILDLFTRPMINIIRLDALLCFAALAALAAINRENLIPVALLLATRAFMVSYYDNAYHYGTDPVDPGAALNLAVPRWFRWLILNHNLHRTHHRYPLASWAVLPQLQVRDEDGFDGHLFTTGLAQLKGPVRRPAPSANSGS